MATYDFMTNAELSMIAQEKITMLEMSDPIFMQFPTRTRDVDTVLWEQRDNYRGLQYNRGINGQFIRVVKTPMKRFAITPAYFGEGETLDEIDLTRLRQPGQFGAPLNLDGLIGPIQDKLLSREIDRRRAILWNLSTYGAVSIVNDFGAVAYADSYTPQTFTASVPWSTLATSTPLADLRNIKILARGKGVRFDKTATLWLNQQTVNNVLNNTNPADLGKKLTNNGSNVNSLDDVNKIFLANDLPQIGAYDEGYITEVGITLGGVVYAIGDFVPFINNTKGVLFGKRIDGSTVGEYQMTRNANNPNMAAGPYNEVIESREPPKSITVYRGHNGAPTLYYPGSMVVLNV